jgi:hypothetical protein
LDNSEERFQTGSALFFGGGEGEGGDMYGTNEANGANKSGELKEGQRKEEFNVEGLPGAVVGEGV